MFQILIFNTGEIIDFWSTVSAIKIFFAKQQQIKSLQYLHFGIIFRFINTINLKIETFIYNKIGKNETRLKVLQSFQTYATN